MASRSRCSLCGDSAPVALVYRDEQGTDPSLEDALCASHSGWEYGPRYVTVPVETPIEKVRDIMAVQRVMRA